MAVRKPVKVSGPCPFCQAGKLPDYKDWKTLLGFVNPRGKIKPSDATGVCSKHQRRLGKEIKRGRHLGLLPFTGD